MTEESCFDDEPLLYIDRGLANHHLYSICEPVISALAVLNAKIRDDDSYAGMLKLARFRDAAAIYGGHSAQDLLMELLAVETTGSSVFRPGRLGLTIQHLAAQQLALSLVARFGKGAFLLDHLCNVHLVLTSHIAVNGERGAMRASTDQKVRVGYSGREIKPADPLPYMKDVLDFVHNPPPLPLVLRAGLLYFQVCAIAPFGYGNEAMAMLMVQMLLAAEGYPAIPCHRLVRRSNNHRSEGLNSLRKREGITSALTLFLSDLLNGILGLNAELTHALQTCERWTLALGNTRRDAAVRHIIPLLLTQPLITVSSVQRTFDLPFPTASGGLTTLVNLKILTVVKVDNISTRSRLFCAKDIINFNFDSNAFCDVNDAQPVLDRRIPGGCVG